MKERLYTLNPKISRRGFCGGAVAAVALGACGGGDPRISVGGLDGGEDLARDPNGPPLDFSQTPGSDLASDGAKDMAKTQDLSQSSSCTGSVSGGAASAVVAGTPVYISSAKVFVCRDSGGLYAMSSACTHAGCKLTPEATEFWCNCHGATFDLNGQSPTSPAHSPLNHYAMCVNASGDVEIDTSQVVAYTTRA